MQITDETKYIDILHQLKDYFSNLVKLINENESLQSLIFNKQAVKNNIYLDEDNVRNYFDLLENQIWESTKIKSVKYENSQEDSIIKTKSELESKTKIESKIEIKSNINQKDQKSVNKKSDEFQDKIESCINLMKNSHNIINNFTDLKLKYIRVQNLRIYFRLQINNSRSKLNYLGQLQNTTAEDLKLMLFSQIKQCMLYQDIIGLSIDRMSEITKKQYGKNIIEIINESQINLSK